MMAVAHAPVGVATAVTTISSPNSGRRHAGFGYRSFFYPVCGMNDVEFLKNLIGQFFQL